MDFNKKLKTILMGIVGLIVLISISTYGIGQVISSNQATVAQCVFNDTTYVQGTSTVATTHCHVPTFADNIGNWLLGLVPGLIALFFAIGLIEYAIKE